MAEKRQCPGCGQDVTVNPSGSLRKHHDPSRNGFVCDGSPAPAPSSDQCEACGRKDVFRASDGVLGWHRSAAGVVCAGSPSLQPLTNDPAPAPFGDDTVEGQDCPACGHWVYGSACTEDGCGWEAPGPTAIPDQDCVECGRASGHKLDCVTGYQPKSDPNDCRTCGVRHVGAHTVYLCTCRHCSRQHTGDYGYGECGNCTCTAYTLDPRAPIYQNAPVLPGFIESLVYDDGGSVVGLDTPERECFACDVVGCPGCGSPDRHDPASVSDPEADAFLMSSTTGAPAPAARPTNDADAEAFLDAEEPTYRNASGQKREKTNRSGYLITDPVTDDFNRYKNGNIKGFTRCTTLVKAASDTATLTDWKQRNVLIGAAKRPDVAARAHGLTHEGSKHELNALVEELEDIAGAKVASGVGTELHEYTERLDAGQTDLGGIPPYWRRFLAQYQETLSENGLRPVPGLIERTTMTHKYGGVAGTFDRILYHVLTGTYVMSDVKTGKGALDYGKQEIRAQLAVYTDGFNANGVYDWDNDSWSHPVGFDGEPIFVRTDFGLIIHMPVQGDAAFTVDLYEAELDLGRAAAQQCYEVRRDRSAAPKFQRFSGFGHGPADPTAYETWAPRFHAVSNTREASRLWKMARAAGVSPLDRGRLVRDAQDSLRALDSQG